MNKYGVGAYDFRTSTITLTIPFDKSGFDEKNATVKLSDAEKSIYDSILKNPNVTVEELVIIIEKHKTTIIKALKMQKAKGRIGSDKNGHWPIKK